MHIYVLLYISDIAYIECIKCMCRPVKCESLSTHIYICTQDMTYARCVYLHVYLHIYKIDIEDMYSKPQAKYLSSQNAPLPSDEIKYSAKAGLVPASACTLPRPCVSPSRTIMLRTYGFKFHLQRRYCL